MTLQTEGNAVNRTCEEERGGGHGMRCEINRLLQAGAVSSPLFLHPLLPSKTPACCRQPFFQPCNPSVVLYVGFFFLWLLLFKMWSDQPGTVHLSYLASELTEHWGSRFHLVTHSKMEDPRHTEKKVLFSWSSLFWIIPKHSWTFIGLT